MQTDAACPNDFKRHASSLLIHSLESNRFGAHEGRELPADPQQGTGNQRQRTKPLTIDNCLDCRPPDAEAYLPRNDRNDELQSTE